MGVSERDERLRAAWRVMVARQIDAERLVVVRGLYAWAPKAKDREPAAQVPTTGKEHDATLVYERRGDGFFPVRREGATNREVFEAYVERMLAPELCPCQVVVIGNLSDHKGERFKEQIEGSGCELLYLPSYPSPDLNLIEEAFSKITGILRKAGPRTREALVEAIGRAPSVVSARDARGFLGHCDYRPPVQLL